MANDILKKKHAHLFRVIDSDRNGAVEWDDYERLASNIAAVRGYEPGTAEHEAIMGQYRQAWELAAGFAGDESLDLDRWLEYMAHITGHEDVYENLIQTSAFLIFDTFDADGDERLTLGEWKDFFRCYGVDPSQADVLFDAYDVNGDGHVSRSELTTLVEQFYLGTDADAPGNLLFGRFE